LRPSVSTEPVEYQFDGSLSDGPPRSAWGSSPPVRSQNSKLPVHWLARTKLDTRFTPLFTRCPADVYIPNWASRRSAERKSRLGVSQRRVMEFCCQTRPDQK
jgi:hypothetical protein